MTATAVQLRAHERRIAGMLADPECVGDLLLVGLVFARCVDLDNPPMDVVVREAARLVYGQADHGTHLHSWRRRNEVGALHPSASPRGSQRVADVLRSDIRRYVPDLSRAYRCQRPVHRRTRPASTAGVLLKMETPVPLVASHKVCGRTAASGGRDLFVDPVDGTRVAIGVCNQARCRAWWQALRETNEREVAANPPPVPVANWGGVLERHLDEINWVALYQHLDPKWTPPHEEPGWHPPKLQIVITDDADLEVTVVDRPTLTVLEGGWR